MVANDMDCWMLPDFRDAKMCVTESVKYGEMHKELRTVPDSVRPLLFFYPSDLTEISGLSEGISPHRGMGTIPASQGCCADD